MLIQLRAAPVVCIPVALGLFAHVWPDPDGSRGVESASPVPRTMVFLGVTAIALFVAALSYLFGFSIPLAIPLSAVVIAGVWLAADPTLRQGKS